MTINLLNMLSPSDAAGDRESDLAFLRTNVPWVAPEAYLHIVYKPLAETLLRKSAMNLRIPNSFVRFLQNQNGARLFLGVLGIYGIVPTGQLVVRTGAISLPPFNIERANSELTWLDRNHFFAIGMYRFDGSIVCIRREDERVELLAAQQDGPRAVWPSVEDWIGTEVARLSALFDSRGHMLADESATVPSGERSN